MKRRDFPLRVHLQSGASFCHEAIVTHVIFRHVVLAFLSVSFSLSLSLSLSPLSLSLSLSVTDGTIHGIVAAVRDDSRREYRGANWPPVGETA